MKSYQRLLLMGLVALFLVVPIAMVTAQNTFPGDTGSPGLVPCGDPGEPPCQLCHFNGLLNETLRFLIYVAVFIATLMIAYAGFRYVTSFGDPGKVSEAHHIFRNVVIGLILILAAWLIVDTLMKFFYNQSGGTASYGIWNDFGACVPQPGPTPSQRQAERSSDGVAVGEPSSNTTSGGSYVGGSGTYSAAGIESARRNTEQWQSSLAVAAAREGVPPERLRAMMMVESAGNPNAVGAAGEVGLMQIKPSTARTLDPSLRTLTDAEVTTKLKDPQYNIDLGAKYYGNYYRSFNNDVDLATAAYNGGTKANRPSTVCPGQLSWQCGQNGGYQVTRNYIANVNQIEQSLGQ